MDGILDGVVIGVTAERRSHQQVRYLESRGAEIISAPVLRTIDARTNDSLMTATNSLLVDPADILIVQTGQGLQWWLDAADHGDRLDHVLAALRSAEVWCRGAKAASASRAVGLQESWLAEHESVNDIAEHLAEIDLTGHRVAILLDGNDDQRLVGIARRQGADVVELDVYRYAMPLDLEPCHDLIECIITGHVDAVTFTASPAIRHLRGIAATMGRLSLLDRAFEDACLAAVVGPVCADTARDAGWRRIAEPPTARLIPMLDTLTTALGHAEVAGYPPALRR